MSRKSKRTKGIPHGGTIGEEIRLRVRHDVSAFQGAHG
jgi:hypothetical protein